MEKVKLFAPLEYGDQPCCYHEASQELIESVTGGCGPGGFGDYFVPDTVWFLSIKEACKRHDWMYAFGLTIEDKELSDRVFLNNMIRIIDAYTKWGWLKRLRRKRAKTYYNFVKYAGGPSFWHDKNQDAEMG